MVANQLIWIRIPISRTNRDRYPYELYKNSLGRAWRFELFPLTWAEVPDFDLLQALNRGLLPGIYPQRQYQRSLAAYVRDYLTQEVFNEALARNAATFTRFFDALAFCHGELLNYAAIARDCAIDAKTVRTYFEILVDTRNSRTAPASGGRHRDHAVSSVP